MVADANTIGKRVVYVPFGNMRYKDNADGYLELIADSTFIGGKVTFSYNVCDNYFCELCDTDEIIADANIGAKEIECEIKRYYDNN